MEMDNTITASLDDVSPLILGRSCVICEETYNLRHPYDNSQICPCCIKRLREILYPVD